jgi:hypothetical protein
VTSFPRLRGKVGMGEAAYEEWLAVAMRSFPHPFPPQAGEGVIWVNPASG